MRVRGSPGREGVDPEPHGRGSSPARVVRPDPAAPRTLARAASASGPPNDSGAPRGGDELDRLRIALDGAQEAYVTVSLHHPPLPMRSRWLDTVGLDNADDFLDIIYAAGNVRAIVFGHVHQAFDETHRGVRIIGTPSTCAQFLPHSDTFAVDDRPPAYRRITLTPDGGVDTELIWLEEDE